MSLFRFILYSLIAYFVLRLIRRLIGELPASDSARLRSKGGRRPKAPDRIPKSSQMVRCAACGTFIVKGNALEAGGGFYCGEACVEQRVHHA